MLPETRCRSSSSSSSRSRRRARRLRGLRAIRLRPSSGRRRPQPSASRRRWSGIRGSSALVRGRLDPATATGLALTLALGLAMVGGMLVGMLAYLVRSSDTLVDTDCVGRPVGRRQRDQLVDRRASAGHQLGSTYFVVDRARRRRGLRVPRVPNKWVPVIPRDRRRRGDRAHQHDQGDPRPRSADVQPDRRDARAVVPERSLGAGRSLLRRSRARARTQAIAEDARAARRRRRRDRGRRRLQSRPSRRPLDVGRHRRARVRLGLVRHLRDRVRWALPRARRAGRAGS